MNAPVVSTALKRGSKTLSAARAVQCRLEADGFVVDLADLTAEPLPQCNGAACEAVRAMVRRVKLAELIVIGFPIYNFQPNSAAHLARTWRSR